MKSYLVVALLAVSVSLVEPVPHRNKPLDKRFIKGLWDNWFNKSGEEEEVTETPAPQEPTPDCSEAEAKLKEWMDEHGDHTDKRFIKGLWNKWFGSKGEEEPSAEAPEPTEPAPGDCAAIEAKLKELMEGHPDHEDETEDFTSTSPHTTWMPEDFTSTSPHTTWMAEDTWMPEESTGDFTTHPATTEPYTPDESEFFTTTTPPTTWMPDEFTGDFTTPPPTSMMPDKTTEDFTTPPAESWMTWVPEDPADCVDELHNCKELALRGKCNRNENTRKKCANSCICNPPCEDMFFNCADLAGRNKCQTKPVVQQRCKKTCGLC